MKQVRRGVFETNSSSQHSIVVMKDQGNFKGTYDDKQLKTGIYVEHDGTWDIWNDDDLEFGRGPFNILCTPGEKFRYAIASYCMYYKDYREANEKFSKIEELAKKVLSPIGVTKVKVPTSWRPIYRDKDGNKLKPWEIEFRVPTGADDTRENYDYCYKDNNNNWVLAVRANKDNDDDFEEAPNYGFVDHQSAGLLQSFLEKTGISLKDFIINKKYVVVIDGDEYCELEKFLDFGVIGYSGIKSLFRYGVMHDIDEEFKEKRRR